MHSTQSISCLRLYKDDSKKESYIKFTDFIKMFSDTRWRSNDKTYLLEKEELIKF